MKLFVTVGTMLPFDRLIVAMDRWCAGHPGVEVFAQVGASDVNPAHMQYAQMLSPIEYRKYCESADLLVSHVGMGTVLTAFELRKRLVGLPRRVELKEVTSMHQEAAARWLVGRPGVHIADQEGDLDRAIDAALRSAPPTTGSSDSLEALVGAVRRFISAS